MNSKLSAQAVSLGVLIIPREHARHSTLIGRARCFAPKHSDPLATVFPHPTSTAHALPVEAQTLVAAVTRARQHGHSADWTCEAFCTLTLFCLGVARSLGTASWAASACRHGTSGARKSSEAAALAFDAFTVAGAARISTSEAHRAVLATPTAVANALLRILARAMAAAAAAHRAIRAEETCKAEANTLDAVTFVGALVGAVGLACHATVPCPTFTSTLLAAYPAVVAVLQAFPRGQLPQRCSLQEAVHSLRCSQHRCSMKLDAKSLPP